MAAQSSIGHLVDSDTRISSVLLRSPGGDATMHGALWLDEFAIVTHQRFITRSVADVLYRTSLSPFVPTTIDVKAFSVPIEEQQDEVLLIETTFNAWECTGGVPLLSVINQ